MGRSLWTPLPRSIELSPSDGPRDTWAVPIVLLWCSFFAVGLDPEVTFLFLREAGHVVSQRALVNSPHLVTLGLAGFLSWHIYSCCRDAGLAFSDAQARALQTGVLALAAFLNFPLQHFLNAGSLPTIDQRLLVWSVGMVKYVVWLYLLFTMIRFHLFGRVSAFTGMVSVFPSTYGDASGNGANAKFGGAERPADAPAESGAKESDVSSEAPAEGTPTGQTRADTVE